MINFPNVAVKLREMDKDELRQYNEEATSALDADQSDRLRGIRNLSGYTGLSYMQWDSGIARAVADTNRKPETYNMLAYYVDGLAGNYIANWFDPKFIATREEDIDTYAELQRVYYIDKERFSYKLQSLNALINGLCYRGVVKIYVDRTRDPRGEIRLASCRPDMIVFDPSVYTDNIARDSKKSWEYFYLDLDSMVYLYNAKADEIIASKRKQEQKNTKPYETIGLASFHDLKALKRIGKRYQCIEHLHIETEPRRIRKDMISGLDVPDFKGKKEQAEWEHINGVDLNMSEQTAMIMDVVKYSPTLYTTTWCPELAVTLENRIDERQLDGRLPLYDWSYITKNGKSCGVVDLLWDAQQAFNAIQTSKKQWLTQTAKNKPIFHDDAFQGDQKLKQEIIDNLSDPSKPIVLPAGAPPPNQAVGQMMNQEPPQLLYQAEQMELQLLQLIARMPPALQGITERTNESGIHYGRKVIEANILQRVPVEKLIQFQHDIAEGYATLAQTVYGGPQNANREFLSSDGKSKAVLNEYAGYDEQLMEPVVKKDISTVNRPNVIISVSPENDYMKQAKREMDTEILKSMSQSPDPSNAEVRAMFENRLLLNSDFTELSEKEEAEAAVERRKQLLSLQMDTLIAQAALAKTSIGQQLQQVTQPPAPPGQPGMPGQPGQAMQTPQPQPGPDMATQVQPSAKPMINPQALPQERVGMESVNKREPVTPIKPIG